MRGYPLLIFGNTVNELMIGTPSPSYARSMAGVTPRKMWLAEEGDILVTPVPIPQRFKEYVCSVLEMNPERVLTTSPAQKSTALLAEAVRNNGILHSLHQWIDERPSIQIQCFALDDPTFTLVRELGVPVDFYSALPDHKVREQIYRLNTKSGFRQAAEMLGLKIVPGASCSGLDELCDAVGKTIQFTGGVIIKFDRSSNGYGHIVLNQSELPGGDLREYLHGRLTPFNDQPQIFTVEAYMQFVSVPSVEMVIRNSGPAIIHTCDQRCQNWSFTGLLIPPPDLKQEIHEEMLRAGRRFAEYAFDVGIRGVLDVDCGVTADGTLYVTETNLRRTGGTYLDTLVRRLVSEDYLASHVWIADSRVGGIAPDFFAGWKQLQNAGLAFDRSAQQGIILTANTLEIDNKWRYLVIARDMGTAYELEARMEKLFQLQPAIHLTQAHAT